jgi:hypothetical protein
LQACVELKRWNDFGEDKVLPRIDYADSVGAAALFEAVFV